MAKKAAEKTSGDDKNQPQFSIQRIYVKGSSFESPRTPQAFLEPWRPKLELNLKTTHSELKDNNYEVVLNVTVSIKSDDNEVAIIGVQQAGIFNLQNFTDEQLKALFNNFCANILYPYAREVVTDLVARGGFPQLYLGPINFDALYAQQQKKEKENKG